VKTQSHLEAKGEVPLNTTTEAGISRPKDERAKLSEIIDVLNDRFGTDFDGGRQIISLTKLKLNYLKTKL
jgi:hypothetical protein